MHLLNLTQKTRNHFPDTSLAELRLIRESIDRLEGNITWLRKTADRQERNSSSFVDDRIRDSAGHIFGRSAMKRFLAKSIYDLVLLSSPFESPHEDLLTGEKGNFD